MQRHVAAGFDASFSARPMIPGECLHPDIVAHQEAVEADPPADDVVDDDRRLARGPVRVPMSVEQVAGHPHRRVAQSLERFEVDRQLILAGVDHGQRQMTVEQCPPVPRNMLDHAEHPGRRQPVEDRSSKRRNLHWLRPQSAVADDVGRARLANVEHRQAIDIDPDLVEHQPERPRIDQRRLDRRRWRQLVQAIELLAAREAMPFGRSHPRHTPAFLIDQDRHPVMPLERAQRIGQPLQLLAGLDIAPEQDVAGGLGIGEKPPLRRVQFQPFNAVNRRLHYRTTKQFSPPAVTAAHAVLACSVEAAPARSRTPPLYGTICFDRPATAGKRDDSIRHAVSALAVDP